MLLIIPILIRVSTIALSRGAGAIVARWAGGNIIKQAVATAVVEKAIDKAGDVARSGDWRSAFREDPAEAIKNVAARALNVDRTPLSAAGREVGYWQTFKDAAAPAALEGVADELERAAKNSKNGEILFDSAAAARNYADAMLKRGFEGVGVDEVERAIDIPDIVGEKEIEDIARNAGEAELREAIGSV